MAACGADRRQQNQRDRDRYLEEPPAQCSRCSSVRRWGVPASVQRSAGGTDYNGSEEISPRGP